MTTAYHPFTQSDFIKELFGFVELETAIKLRQVSKLYDFLFKSFYVPQLLNDWKYPVNDPYTQYKTFTIKLKKSYYSSLIRIIYTAQQVYFGEKKKWLESKKNQKKMEKITSLNLSKLNLITIHPSVKFLKNAKKINLSENPLRKIPENFTQLDNLILININFCKLKTIPLEIFQLQNLEHLQAIGNKINKIEDEIKKLKNLQKLYLGSNSIHSLSPNFIYLTKLTVLDLTNNNFTEFPLELKKLTNLNKLFTDFDKVEKTEETLST